MIIDHPKKPVAVLKFGGEVVANTKELFTVLSEVCDLTEKGWRFVICHGGNPQANALTERLHLEKKQIGGRRVTDLETLRVMKQVLAGECNVDVVACAAAAGLKAVGISGVSAGMVTAIKRPPQVFSGCGPEPIDFGYVGEITRINPELIFHLWEGGFTPILNTLAIEAKSDATQKTLQVYNINADTVTAAIAATIKTDHLFLITNVPGVLRDKDDPATRIPQLTRAEALKAIADGIIVGGMIPKIEEALRNLDQGIRSIHILGAHPGTLHNEALNPGSRGTVLV